MKTLLFLSLFITSSLSFASFDRQDLSKYSISSKSTHIKKIVERFEVVSATEKTIELYVPPFKANELLLLDPRAKLLERSIYSDDVSILKRGYRNFDEVVQTLKAFKKNNLDTVDLQTYGKSANGESLYYIKVSDNVLVDENEPELLITAATHGDELITTESLLRFIENFLKEAKTNEKYKELINNHEIYFIPVVNPDGFKRRRRYTADGTDPNREYPYPLKPEKKSVQCISELIKFFHSRDFQGTIDLHAYGEMVMYPWGYTKEAMPSADKERMHSLGLKMAQKNRYEVGQISKVIYVAPASSADYFYWKKNTLSYGIELGRSKAPMSWSIPKVVEHTKEILVNFIDHF